MKLLILKEDDKGYFAIYHPAAGMQFPKIKKILEEDFQKLKSKFLKKRF